METRRFLLGVLAYVVPTFMLGFLWHLRWFADYYADLQIYRDDVVVPLGLGSILVQGFVFSLAYRRFFGSAPVRAGAPRFGFLAGLLSWTFTTLAVAAKHPMTSVPAFVLIETAFTAIQFAAVAPLMALAWRSSARVVGEPIRGG